VSRKTLPFLYFELLGETELILIIFGVQNQEKISYKNVVNLFTSPE